MVRRTKIIVMRPSPYYAPSLLVMHPVRLSICVSVPCPPLTRNGKVYNVQALTRGYPHHESRPNWQGYFEVNKAQGHRCGKGKGLMSRRQLRAAYFFSSSVTYPAMGMSPLLPPSYDNYYTVLTSRREAAR